MRNRRIRILHEGREYFLVDRGRSAKTRALTLLKRVEDERTAEKGELLVKTDVGLCQAVAHWTAGEARIEKGHESLREAFDKVVGRYLEEFRVGRTRTGTRTYWFLSSRRQALYSLDRSQPAGLVVLLYSGEEAAKEAALARRGIDTPSIAIEPVTDLSDYLEARALEGFAGALLDDRSPIYFCSDPGGSSRFLKIDLDERTGRLEHRLLDADGAWTPYDGEEEIFPDLDQDVVDDAMRERLGDLPFLGFRDGIVLYRLERKGAPGVPATVELADDAATDGVPLCPIFHDLDLLESFRAEHDLDDCGPAPVDDLRELAAWCGREGRTLVLHPDGHRARTATLWAHDGRLLLDSFSGIWRSTDGVRFEKE
ncbi:MAG: hypothetical protein ACF8XB_18985 [Planctomycetota bacterium JB042]